MMYFSFALIALGSMAFLAYLGWLLSQGIHSRGELMRLHLEGRNRLLDRIENPRDLLDFAQTEEGHRILEAPQLPAQRKPAPAGLYLIVTGIISLCAGLAFRESYYVINSWKTGNLHFDPSKEYAEWLRATEAWSHGALLLYVGVGLVVGGLLSAGLSHLAHRRAMLADGSKP